MIRRGSRRDLNELARLHGVQRSYEDVTGERRHASPEALFLTLRALGLPLASPADAAEALQARRETLNATGVDPVHVAWGGRLGAIHLRVGERAAATPAQLTLRLETGEVRTWRAPFEEAKAVRGHAPRQRLPVRGPLPVGYHELEIETAGQTLRTRVISAPRHAFNASDECSWGVFAPLYAVRTADDDGAGDFQDLARLAEWVGARGGGYVGTLPLLATFLREPFEPSPYSPVSRLFWNELYVAPAVSPGARVEDDGELVDYRSVAEHRRAALEAECASFLAGESRERAEFEQYVEGRARVSDYARFRATCDHYRTGWHGWPQPLRDGELDHAEAPQRTVDYYLYAQWRAEQQLAAIAQGAQSGGAALYLDLPLGVNPDGYDAWRFRDVFVEGASAGAPPDTLFTGGQDWGFRPLSPERLRATGYAYLIESVRHHLRHASMLRLDHVMSLFRLYWIPAGLSAREGVYVQYPADEMLAVLLTESARHRARIVGEDLGTVPRAVRAAMDRRHIQRIFVVQYEVAGGTAPLNETPRNSVASVNTHDMPPFAAFLRAAEVDDQLDLGLVDAPEAAAARASRDALVDRLHAHFGSAGDPRRLLEMLLRHLAVSDARTVLVNLEDLWLEEHSQNVPGTSHERPNWQRRFTRTLEQIMADPQIAATLRTIDTLRCGGVPAEPPNLD